MRFRIGGRLIFWSLFLLILMSCANRAFYVPSKVRAIPPPSPLYRTSEIAIPSGEGELAAWVLEPVGRPPLGTVLFSHGNAGNMNNHLAFADFMVLNGYRLVLYDYRGYGGSSPLSPSRESTVEDLNAALDSVLVTYGKPWLYGHSLGASLSLWVAGQRPADVSGVISVAAFVSYRSAARGAITPAKVFVPITWPLGFLVSRGEDPIDAIDLIAPTPVLLVHGKQDSIIPPWMCEKLYEKARDPKRLLLLDGVGHNDGWKDMGESFVNAVLKFMEDPNPRPITK